MSCLPSPGPYGRHLLPTLFLLLLLKYNASVQPFRSSGLASVTIIKPTTTLSQQQQQQQQQQQGRRPTLVFPLQLSTRGDDGDGIIPGNDEVAYDITLNLFPEDRRIRKESSFADGERSEMNDRPPPATSSPQRGRSAPATTTTTTVAAASASASTTSTDATKTQRKSIDDRASSLYQKIISQRKTQVKSTKIKGDDEAYYDITQSSFPEKERPRSSLEQGQLSEMNSRNPRGRKTPPPRTADGEETRLDITSIFPNDRPSRLVNTGTKKEWTTSGSYYDGEGKKRGSNEESSSNASPTPAVRNNADHDDDDGDDGASFDIAQQHFGTDRATFRLHVNSGWMERRGTHSGQVTPRSSYVEGYRNIAHNFSSNRASLLGHPPPRKVVRGDDGGGDGVYLNRHQFSYSVSPASVATSATSSSSSKIATNAMWRRGCDPTPSSPSSSSSSSEKKKDADDEIICLDTPRAFAKNLDMIASTKRVVVPTEADKYLDTHAFAWNTIDSAKKRKLPVGSTRRRQPYLDEPRPFQSNVDMVSSNFSGAKFKRSSDIPPEWKHIKDYYYDVSTVADPVPILAEEDATTMAKMGGGSSDDRGNGWMEKNGHPPIDSTTRAGTRFSTVLERTSSVIRDGNGAASRAWTNDEQFGVRDVEGNSSDELSSFQREVDDGDDASEPPSSFDGVMHWLLTHLPNLTEEDAVSYFHHLLEDGFDTVDILKELLEEDLYFMKKGHRRAMMRSLGASGSSSAIVSAEVEEGDGATIVENGAEESILGRSQTGDGADSSATKSATSKESSPEVVAMEEDDAVAALDRAPDQAEKDDESVEDVVEDR